RVVARRGRVADGGEGRGGLGRRRPRRVALEQGIGGGELHAPQLVGGKPIEGLPRRDAQGRFQQLAAAAHLHGVLHEAPDIALDDVELLGRIVRFQRLLALLAEPDLMDEDVRLRRHVAALAGQQQEGAHGFAIAIRRQRGATIAVAARRQRRRLADGGDHAEAANGAAKRKRAQDRATVGIENQDRSACVGVLGEGLELARRVGGDVNDGGNADERDTSRRRVGGGGPWGRDWKRIAALPLSSWGISGAEYAWTMPQPSANALQTSRRMLILINGPSRDASRSASVEGPSVPQVGNLFLEATE